MVTNCHGKDDTMFDKIMVAIDKSEITNKLLDATVEIAQNKQTQVVQSSLYINSFGNWGTFIV